MGGRGRIGQGEDARKLRQRFDWLESFTDDELGSLNFLREGDATNPNEEYFDISNPEMGILSSNDLPVVDEGSRYIPKSEVPRDVWDKLVGPFV